MMADKWWEFDKHTMYELKWIIDDAKDLDRGKGVVDNFLDKDKVLVAFSRLDWAFIKAMFKDYDDKEELEGE
tara:strand:- start:312 stop:527 length:216 start_codon:yes stop_codon:yes gene_type:complete